MTPIELTASIDAQGQLHLDRPLTVGEHSNVRVIILLPDEDLPENESNESILAGLQQSLQEFKDGKAIPLERLWDGIDAE
jgi:hypothetical protein